MRLRVRERPLAPAACDERALYAVTHHHTCQMRMCWSGGAPASF